MFQYVTLLAFVRYLPGKDTDNRSRHVGSWLHPWGASATQATATREVGNRANQSDHKSFRWVLFLETSSNKKHTQAHATYEKPASLYCVFLSHSPAFPTSIPLSLYGRNIQCANTHICTHPCTKIAFIFHRTFISYFQIVLLLKKV